MLPVSVVFDPSEVDEPISGSGDIPSTEEEGEAEDGSGSSDSGREGSDSDPAAGQPEFDPDAGHAPFPL